MDAKAKLILIGCGDFKNIKHYRKETGFTGEIYTDPDRNLYGSLHLHVSKSMSEFKSDKKSPYSKTGFFSGMGWSFMEMATTSGLGDIYQQGGDFVFQPDGKIIFQHIQQHPNDHVNIEEIFQAAEIQIKQ